MFQKLLCTQRIAYSHTRGVNVCTQEDLSDGAVCEVLWCELRHYSHARLHHNSKPLRQPLISRSTHGSCKALQAHFMHICLFFYTPSLHCARARVHSTLANSLSPTPPPHGHRVSSQSCSFAHEVWSTTKFSAEGKTKGCICCDATTSSTVGYGVPSAAAEHSVRSSSALTTSTPTEQQH